MTTVGRLEVICGPMFAGKTTELIRRLRLHADSGEAVLAVKPARDTRYGAGALRSHARDSFIALEMHGAGELLTLAAQAGIIGIDEAHFFGADLAGPVAALLASGKRVIISGIERDHRGRPFPPFPDLLCEADEVLKLATICARCGAPAIHSHRLFENDDPIAVGGPGEYEARCRVCFRAGA